MSPGTAGDPEALVIGGGVIGVCSAYYLAQQNLRVCLVEQGEIASGCSSANAGLIVPSFCIPLASPKSLSLTFKSLLKPQSAFHIKPRFDPGLFIWLWQFQKACNREKVLEGLQSLRDLNAAGSELLDRLIAGESLDCLYRRDGWLMVYKTDQAFRKAQEDAALLRSREIELKILNPEETLEMEPALLPGISGSVFFHGDSHLNPEDFVLALAERLRKKGVTVHEQTKVLGFEASNGRITAVRTAQASYRPKQIILAAGAWSSGLLQGIGLKLPLQPGKGYCISVKRPESCPSLPLYFTEAKVAVTPLADTLRLAGTFKLAGMDFRMNRGRVANIMSSSARYLQRTEDFDIIQIRTGLRPCSPDGLPFIGRAPGWRNLIVATGHGMLGMTQGPITGKLVARLACDQLPDLSLTPFRLARFS